MAFPTKIKINNFKEIWVGRSCVSSWSDLDNLVSGWCNTAEDENGDPYVGSFIVHYDIDDAISSNGFLIFNKVLNFFTECREIEESDSIFQKTPLLSEYLMTSLIRYIKQHDE